MSSKNKYIKHNYVMKAKGLGGSKLTIITHSEVSSQSHVICYSSV